MNSEQMDIQNQYYDLFNEEFQDLIEQLLRALRDVHGLEKNKDKNPWEVFFRVTHTLKGNAELMGFYPISEISKVSCEVYRGMKRDSNELQVSELYSFSSKLFSLYSLFHDLLIKHKNIDAVSIEPLYNEALNLLEKRGISYPKS